MRNRDENEKRNNTCVKMMIHAKLSNKKSYVIFRIKKKQRNEMVKATSSLLPCKCV